jgi:hypothetical protein
LFSRLYEETIEKSSKHKINEYQIFKDFYENKNVFSKNNFAIIDAIANEKFEETTKRIDKNLSNGKTIDIITFQDAFIYYRDKYIQSSQFGLNNDSYQKNNIKRHKTKVDYNEIRESLSENLHIKSTEGKVKLHKFEK